MLPFYAYYKAGGPTHYEMMAELWKPLEKPITIFYCSHKVHELRSAF